MAFHANTFRARAKFCIRWMLDAMIAVAYHASWQRKRFKCLIVRTLHVHLGLEDMAVRANVLDLVDTGRDRTMVSMAGCAGWRAKITPHRQRVVMHAGVVLRKLICGNAVLLHVLRVRVAARARLRYVDRVDRGPGIGGWPYIVNAVTVDAYRSLGVSSGIALAMHAGVVLVQLVRTQAGIELFYVGRIRMTTSTQLWNLLAINLALESRLAAHGDGWIVTACVTSVTTGAGQTPLRVNVLAELFLSNSQRIRQSRVAIETGVCGLPITQAHSEHNLPGQPDIV